MSEIKPVYQTRFVATDFPEDWANADKQLFDHRKDQPDNFETRILYPAAAYESQRNEVERLQRENAAQAKRIVELEELIKNSEVK